MKERTRVNMFWKVFHFEGTLVHLEHEIVFIDLRNPAEKGQTDRKNSQKAEERKTGLEACSIIQTEFQRMNETREWTENVSNTQHAWLQLEAHVLRFPANSDKQFRK